MTSRAGHAGRIFIGVDAGATKIRAAILDTSTGRIARIEGSGSNAVVDGPEAAAGRIVELLSSLSGIGGIAVGLAGAWSARIRGRVAAILRRNLKPDRLTVMNDASAVLAAMAPSTNAVLLNVGTGSVAVGRTRNGRLLRADGWGPLAGDAGSGYWIGRRALESALKAKDGRGPRTALARTVLRKTGIERPEENIHRLYSSPAPQAIVASLAPLVIRAARHGDSTARGIVRDAAAALASTAGAVLRRMPSGRTRLFAAGGLGTSAPELFAKVRAIAGSRRIKLEWLPAEPDAACLALALKFAGLEARFAEALGRLPGLKPRRQRAEDGITAPITESSNPATARFSRLSPLNMIRLMNREDAKVAPAIGAILPAVARAVKIAERALKRGGRLIYVGAGTSGRLGVLDASEAPPTFGVPDGTVVGLIAGGDRALTRSSEGAEDDARAGTAVIRRLKVGPRDFVIGLSASGGARFVLAAVTTARRRGASTAGLTVNPRSRLARGAQVALVPRTGAEVVAGSTRLKAGTAQKLVLNMISTAAFARIGRVAGNVMTHLRPVNEKLRGRAVGITASRLGIAPAEARRRLEARRWNLPWVLKSGINIKEG